MAKKTKPVKVDPNIIDYYALYGLVRGADSKELVSQLRKKQGMIKQQMSGGALNSPEVMNTLMEQDKLVAAAIKIFKNEERLAAYNEQLDAAIAAGTLNTAAQEAAENALAEIERLFLKGSYNAVIRKCRESLSENGANAKVYNWLAQSYFLSGQADASVATVDEYAKNYPNDLNALHLGVRYYTMGKDDVQKGQEFVNRILELDADGSLANLDQIYVYVHMRNLDAAFGMLDSYIQEHPADVDFKQSAAYDLIGVAAALYEIGGAESVAYLTSDADYQLCKKLCDKAQSVYNDPEIKEYVEYTNLMGEVEFNEDNIDTLKWCALGSVLYAMPAVGGLFAIKENGFFPVLLALALAVGCIYVTINLLKVSKRPQWQILKYVFTGEREPNEQKFITLGKILAGWIHWCWKAGWALFRFAMSLAFGG